MAYIWRFHVLAPVLEMFRLSAIMTLAAWGFLLVAPGGRTLVRGLRRPFIAFYLTLLLWALLGHSFGLWPEGSYAVLKDVHFRNVLFLLFIVGTINSVRRLEVAVAAHVLGAAALAFFYIKGGTPTQWTPVSTYDRNDLALLFNMSLPLVLWYWQEHPSNRIRWVLGGVALALIFSVVMSQSRGGFLGLGIIMLFLLLTQKTIKLRYRLAPIAIVSVGWFFLPAEVTDRLSTLTSLDSDYNVESATGRVEIWKRGLSYVSDRPVFGIGLDNFALAEATLSEESRQFAGRWRASVAHNTYLEIMVETGYLGGALYVGVIVSMIIALSRTRRRLHRIAGSREGRAMHRLVGYLLASALGFAVGSFFLSTFSLSLLVAQMGLVGSALTISQRMLTGSTRRRIRKPPHRGYRPPVTTPVVLR